MRKSTLSPMFSLFAALWIVASGVGGAQAQTPRSISGSFGQLFRGGGLGIFDLPIPHPSFGPFDPSVQTFTGMAPTFVGTPVGGVKAKPSAFAVTSSSGATLRLSPRQITHGSAANPRPGVNVPRFATNSLVFQVYTNLSVLFPRVPGGYQSGQMSDSAFFANGRTGPDFVSWCPGLTLTVRFGANPGCSFWAQAPVMTIPDCTGVGQCPHASQTLMIPIQASVRYQRTSGQLGGAARLNLGGSFNFALNRWSVTKPSSPATVHFFGGPANPTPAIGGAFGVMDQRAVPVLESIRVSGFTPNGNIAGMTTETGIPPPSDIPAEHTVAGFGVPFTAGQLVFSVRSGSFISVFTLTGSSNRTASGAGNLTLVGGAVTLRSLSGLGVDRGIVSFDLPEPPAIAGATAALLVLLACHRLMRRRSR